MTAIDRPIAHDGMHDDIGNAVHAQGPGQVKEFMFLLPSLFIQIPQQKFCALSPEEQQSVPNGRLQTPK